MNARFLLPMILSMILLAACGSGGDGGGGNLMGGQPPIGPTITVEITARDEFEPNNSIVSADAHTMPTPGGDVDYVGFGVLGSVHDLNDTADYFLFTAARDSGFTVQLCTSFCDPVGGGPFIDTSVAYFEILDQSGTLLLSSQGDIEAGNDQVIDITGGLVYYLGVFPEDTVGATQDYYVEMVEEILFP